MESALTGAHFVARCVERSREESLGLSIVGTICRKEQPREEELVAYWLFYINSLCQWLSTLSD